MWVCVFIKRLHLSQNQKAGGGKLSQGPYSILHRKEGKSQHKTLQKYHTAVLKLLPLVKLDLPKNKTQNKWVCCWKKCLLSFERKLFMPHPKATSLRASAREMGASEITHEPALCYHGSNMINSCGTCCNNISLVTSFVIHVAAIRTQIHHLKDTKPPAICAVPACEVLWISSSATAAQLFSPGSWSCQKKTADSDLDGLGFRIAPMSQRVQTLFWCWWEKSSLPSICHYWVLVLIFFVLFPITLVKSLIFLHLSNSLTWQILGVCWPSFCPQHGSHLNLIIRKSWRIKSVLNSLLFAKYMWTNHIYCQRLLGLNLLLRLEIRFQCRPHLNFLRAV